MIDWTTLGLAVCIVAAVQWTVLLLLPMSLTYYEGGQAKRRTIRMGHLVRHMAKGRVELHGPLLFVDNGIERGNVGGHWSVLALAFLVIAPWITKSRLH